MQDAHGPRFAGLWGTALLAGGFFAASQVPVANAVLFLLVYSLPAGLGSAFLAPAVLACAQKWYKDKKGWATGVAGVADAATNAAANAIEDLEAAESRGFSTRFPLNSAFIFTFGALGGMLFGFDTGIISGASPLIESDFGLSVSQTGFITSSVLIGSCAGALSIGALSDRFGRKKLLIVSALLFLLGSGRSLIR